MITGIDHTVFKVLRSVIENVINNVVNCGRGAVCLAKHWKIYFVRFTERELISI